MPVRYSTSSETKAPVISVKQLQPYFILRPAIPEDITLSLEGAQDGTSWLNYHMKEQVALSLQIWWNFVFTHYLKWITVCTASAWLSRQRQSASVCILSRLCSHLLCQWLTSLSGPVGNLWSVPLWIALSLLMCSDVRDCMLERMGECEVFIKCSVVQFLNCGTRQISFVLIQIQYSSEAT